MERGDVIKIKKLYSESQIKGRIINIEPTRVGDYLTIKPIGKDNPEKELFRIRKDSLELLNK